MLPLSNYVDVHFLPQVMGYWAYELCHGQYLRQYHEDKNAPEGKVRLLHWGIPLVSIFRRLRYYNTTTSRASVAKFRTDVVT